MIIGVPNTTAGDADGIQRLSLCSDACGKPACTDSAMEKRNVGNRRLGVATVPGTPLPLLRRRPAPGENLEPQTGCVRNTSCGHFRHPVPPPDAIVVHSKPRKRRSLTSDHGTVFTVCASNSMTRFFISVSQAASTPGSDSPCRLSINAPAIAARSPSSRDNTFFSNVSAASPML